MKVKQLKRAVRVRPHTANSKCHWFPEPKVWTEKDSMDLFRQTMDRWTNERMVVIDEISRFTKEDFEALAKKLGLKYEPVMDGRPRHAVYITP